MRLIAVEYEAASCEPTSAVWRVAKCRDVLGWAEVAGDLYCTGYGHPGERKLPFGSYVHASARGELLCLPCAKAARVMG